MPTLSRCGSTAPLCGSINTGWVRKGDSTSSGRSQGDPSTQISVRVDALGHRVRFVLLPIPRHNRMGVAPVLAGVECEVRMADRDDSEMSRW